MKYKFISAEILLVVASTFILTACESNAARRLKPGEWEVTQTVTGDRGELQPPQTDKHCLFEAEAASPTLQGMLSGDNRTTGRVLLDKAVVKDGQITSDSTTGKGTDDSRNLHETIRGTFTEESFDYIYTIRLMGTDIPTHVTGRRLGRC